MENRPAIEQKLLQLNREEWEKSGGRTAILPPATIPQIWQEFPGYNALTKFDFNNGAPLFSPSVGVPVKAFLNTRTGEIRTFLANVFEI